MRAVLFVFSVLVGLTAWSVQAQNAGPSEASPRELLANPERYVNRTVRVRGLITSCFPLGCNICEADVIRAGEHSCLAFDFAADTKDLRIGARVERVLEEQFRFSDVSMEARFDPTCLGSYLGAERMAEGSIRLPDGTRMGLCLDHASVLRDARVVAVHSRKTERDFSMGERRDAIAPPASANERKAMLDVFQRAFSWRPDLKVEVFLAPLVTGEPQFGYGCVCREEDCKSRWPNVQNAALDSPTNPYRCFQMTKENGVWHLALSL